MINPDLTPPSIGVLECQKKYCRSYVMPGAKPNPDYVCKDTEVGSNERFACEDNCKNNCVESGGKRPGTTATTNIFNYPYIVGRINQDSMDSENSSIQSILAQKTPELDRPIMTNDLEECGLIVDPEYEENKDLTPEQIAAKFERCCVERATRNLYLIPAMKNLVKCQLFQSCKHDCIIVANPSDLPCDIKCMGYLPTVTPGPLGTTETVTYCENLIREYEKKYKKAYEEALRTCKRVADRYRNPPTTTTA